MKVINKYYQELEKNGNLYFESIPSKQKDPSIFLNGNYICETEEFIYPFQGQVKKLYMNSALVKIEHTTDYDHQTAKEKNFITVVSFNNMSLDQKG